MNKLIIFSAVLALSEVVFSGEQYVLKTSTTVEVLDNGQTIGTKVLKAGTILRVVEPDSKKASVDIVGEEIVFKFGRGGCFAKSEEISRKENENWVFNTTTRPDWIRTLKVCGAGVENELPKGNATGGTSHTTIAGNVWSYSFKVYVEENKTGKARSWTLPVTDQGGTVLFSLKISQEG